jgi:hypothetical protein
MEEVKAAKSPQAFARELAFALLPWRKAMKRPDSAELPMF